MRQCLIIVIVLLAGVTSALSQSAPAEINAGIQAYKSADYQKAIDHFREAVQFAPQLAVTHLYLAHSYAEMYIPEESSSAENLAFGENALKEYELALQSQPTAAQRIDATRGLALQQFNMKQLEPARQNYQLAIQLQPKNPENYYSLGIIDWMEAYPRRMEIRQSYNLKPGDEMIDGPGCTLLRAENQQKVENGIQMLATALQLNPDYEDAMAYMNLLYREKADYQCGDEEQRRADLRAADDWIDRTMAARKAKADKAAASKPQ